MAPATCYLFLFLLCKPIISRASIPTPKPIRIMAERRAFFCCSRCIYIIDSSPEFICRFNAAVSIAGAFICTWGVSRIGTCKLVSVEDPACNGSTGAIKSITIKKYLAILQKKRKLGFNRLSSEYCLVFECLIPAAPADASFCPHER